MRTPLTEADLAQMLRSGAKIVGSFGGHPQAVPPPPRVTPPTTPDRYRSATERQFAALLTTWQQHGQISAWWYEACKGLWLAPKTSYTPDFLVRDKAGGIAWYEVKGAFIREKDRQKLKQAASLYWCWPFILAQLREGTWHFTQMPA